MVVCISQMVTEVRGADTTYALEVKMTDLAHAGQDIKEKQA